MKLLPASVNPPQPPDVSTSLVLVAPRAITTRAGQISVVPPDDVFAWSSSRRGEANVIDGMPVEDSQSDETGGSAWEYVSGWAWSRLVGSGAVAQYLYYAVDLAGWGGRLIDLYA